MNCPDCNNSILENPKSYYCSRCGLRIYKVIADKKITPAIVKELLASGRTRFFEDFYSAAKRKHFTAALVLKDKRVVFEYPGSNGTAKLNHTTKTGDEYGQKSDQEAASDIVNVRVQSSYTGTVDISITGATYMTTTVEYGLGPPRWTECLGAITALGIINHKLGDPSRYKINLSINNYDLSRYVLEGRLPRDQKIKAAVIHLLGLCSKYNAWSAQYKASKKPRLQGGPQANNFPKGVFPFLRAEVITAGENILVKLPVTPDIKSQFEASMTNAVMGSDGYYHLHPSLEKRLKAWLFTVKGA